MIAIKNEIVIEYLMFMLRYFAYIQLFVGSVNNTDEDLWSQVQNFLPRL